MHVHIYSCFHDKHTVINQIEKHLFFFARYRKFFGKYKYSYLLRTRVRKTECQESLELTLNWKGGEEREILLRNYFMINSPYKDVSKKVLAKSSINIRAVRKELIFYNNNYCQSIFKLFFYSKSLNFTTAFKVIRHAIINKQLIMYQELPIMVIP